MSFLSRFPFLDGVLDPSMADTLEYRFQAACAQAGVETDSPEAEAIGIDLLADHAGGWASSALHGDGQSA